ncbi:MAG: acyltransferase [Muribaculaceae bacterium]|nr:acyltransferase [Muribaculaceae bacterium]
MHRRESSFELLRLVLMFLIIIHHSIVHGMGLTGLVWDKTLPMHFSEWEKPVATIVNCMCICAVNCFVLISGYFSIKFNIKKLISLLITVVIYTFCLCTVYNLAIGNIKGAISRMMIFSHPTYWFVNTYIYLTVFAPLINLMFEKMSKRFQIFFIVSLLFISCYLGFIWLNPLNPNGYNLIQFILMYSIGRFICYYPLRISKIASFILYLVPSVITGVFMFLLWQTGHLGRSWQMTGYNNPLIMLAAIGLFMFFSKIRFKSNMINKWASSAFAIYMVQSSLLSNVLYYKLINWLHIEMGGVYG